MERIPMVLTAVHVLGAIAWLCGMIFHIVVLDPVFRKNEVNFQGAFLLALMEQRFRKLVGTSIVLLVGSGFAKAYLLLKIGLTGAMLVIFAVCPKTKSCSSIPGVCDIASEALLSGGKEGTIRERSKVILPKVALGLGIAALVTAVYLRG